MTKKEAKVVALTIIRDMENRLSEELYGGMGQIDTETKERRWYNMNETDMIQKQMTAIFHKMGVEVTKLENELGSSIIVFGG